MNSKRPEQVHYIPPQRRKNSISGAPVIPPPPPPPPTTSMYVNGSSGRVAMESPVSKHALPVTRSRFEPSKTPPIRPDNTPRWNPQSRTPVSHRDPYDPSTSPSMHHREPVRVELYREHSHMNSRLAPSDPFYKEKSGFASHANGVAGRQGVSPAHLVRNRSYEQDRYAEVVSPFRRGPPAGWMEGMGTKGSNNTPPIRILRNPERERERELRERERERERERDRDRDRDRENRAVSDEHVVNSHAFVVAPAPPQARKELQVKPRAYVAANSGQAAYMGDKIHSLTPSTSLEERCRKFINSLNPDYPDPPLEDEEYHYPETEPLDPNSMPPYSLGTSRRPVQAQIMDKLIPMGMVKSAPAYRPFIPSERDIQSPGRRTRHVARNRNRHHRDEEYDTDEECAGRIYRLQT